MKTIAAIYHMFDILEDKIRGTLSRHPFIYTFIGGSGLVLFWRGVWHTADRLEASGYLGSIVFSSVGSMVVGIIVLLGTGLFVSVFIGDSIIMSGIKKDKKLVEKTIDEVETEKSDIEKVLGSITDLKREVHHFEDEHIRRH